MITLTDEQWKPIPGWVGHYEASTRGRVRSLARTVNRNGLPMRIAARILEPNVHHSGYRRVILSRAGVRSERLLHAVIAETLHGPRPDGLEVLHRDGNQANNAPSNLRYGTSAENSRDTVDHGNHPLRARTHCPLGHELAGPNLVAAELRRGHRKCRACNTARAYAHRNQLGDDALRALADDRYRGYTEATAC